MSWTNENQSYIAAINRGIFTPLLDNDKYLKH